MKKLSILFIMMATWMVVSCTTTQDGCWGHWVESNDGARSGHKRGTIWSNKFNKKPYRQCVDKNVPYKNAEKRPYG